MSDDKCKYPVQNSNIVSEYPALRLILLSLHNSKANYKIIILFIYVTGRGDDTLITWKYRIGLNSLQTGISTKLNLKFDYNINLDRNWVLELT